jgi:hypothetical protein
MGMLNIDEHVEEHRLMAIRYPDKAVIPGQSVIAQSNIPFLIMPGDGASAGCLFTGAAGAASMSSAIVAGAAEILSGCYAYFSDNFGGSTLPAGWYWTEFSSDTALIVYQETYVSGRPRRPATKTPFAINLTGRVTQTTNEIVAITGISIPAGSLGKNGILRMEVGYFGSGSGTRIYRLRTNDVANTQLLTVASLAAAACGESLVSLRNADSHTKKISSRTSTSTNAGIGTTSAGLSSQGKDADTEKDLRLSITMQGNVTASAPVMSWFAIDATFGE